MEPIIIILLTILIGILALGSVCLLKNRGSNPQAASSNRLEIKEVQFPNAEFIPELVKLIDEGHTITLRLRGFSMRPFLEDNRDKALLAKPIKTQLGDVVLAEIAPKHFVLHRVVRLKGNNVTLRGDGNLGTEQCKLTDVKGFAIGFYRKGREKLDKTNALKWRTYSFVWCALLPFRRYLLAFYRRIWLRFFKPI